MSVCLSISSSSPPTTLLLLLLLLQVQPFLMEYLKEILARLYKGLLHSVFLRCVPLRKRVLGLSFLSPPLPTSPLATPLFPIPPIPIPLHLTSHHPSLYHSSPPHSTSPFPTPPHPSLPFSLYIVLCFPFGPKLSISSVTLSMITKIR